MCLTCGPSACTVCRPSARANNLALPTPFFSSHGTFSLSVTFAGTASGSSTTRSTSSGPCRTSSRSSPRRVRPRARRATWRRSSARQTHAWPLCSNRFPRGLDRPRLQAAASDCLRHWHGPTGAGRVAVLFSPLFLVYFSFRAAVAFLVRGGEVATLQPLIRQTSFNTRCPSVVTEGATSRRFATKHATRGHAGGADPGGEEKKQARAAALSYAAAPRGSAPANKGCHARSEEKRV